MTVGYDDTGQPSHIVDLRPMDIGDILDGTIRIYRFIPWVLILIYAIIAGFPLFLQQSSNQFIMGLLAEAGRMITPSSGLEFMNLFQTADFYVAVGVFGVGIFLMFFLGPMAQAAMVYAVSETILGREVSIEGSIRAILPKVGSIILAYVLLGIIILITYLPIILSAVLLFSSRPDNPNTMMTVFGLVWLYPFSAFILLWLMVKLLFIPHSVILDDLGAVDAFKRSFTLVAGYWWRTFGIYILISIIVGIIVALLQQGVSLVNMGLNLIPGIPTLAIIAVAGMLTTVISLVIQPIGIIATTLLYYDLRIRKEGFDLLHLASALARDKTAAMTTSSEHEAFG